MALFVHPNREDISLTNVLAALGDPVRLQIARGLYQTLDGRNCSEAAPFPDVPKSTLSGHFRILRESGIIFTHKKGVENINVLRLADLEARFPGLLPNIFSLI